jgi:hypothetical protein
MKKLVSALPVLALCAASWLAPSAASAVPKMDVKVAVGVGSTTLVPRVPNIDLYDPDTGDFISTVGGRNPSTYPNWGMQLSARVTAGKIFGEIGIGFSRFYFDITQSLADIRQAEGGNADAVQALVGERARMNSLEIPLTAGYVPYKNPYFKLFVYAGWVNTFNLRGFVDLNGNRKAIKFRPKQIPGFPLAIYVSGLRLGTQFDLGPVNFDFNYTISMNSFTTTEFRTNAHVFKMFLGWLF